MLRKITCNRMRELITIKEKVPLYSNQITFSYNQWCHRLHLGSIQYEQFPQKKKNFRKKRGKENEMKINGQKGGKNEKKKKGMERVCAKEGETNVEEKKKQKKEGEGKEKEEEKEKQKIERAAQNMHRPLRTYSLARS